VLIAAAALAISGCREGFAPDQVVVPDMPTPTYLVPSDVAPSEVAELGFDQERRQMVEQQVSGRGIVDTAVLRAMAAVPRHSFVPAQYAQHAYSDGPLPIGHGQTISQPYIVALMTDALELTPDDRVLEIGTGSGYQAAVLAEIVDEVFTIEIVGPLADRARAVHDALDYRNIMSRTGDGYFGWAEEAPFDAIIVTAAPDHVPPPLRDQLVDGGRMVIPVGPVGGYQELWLVERMGDRFKTSSLGGVAFVPLTRE
jgi:protein-L-isoaspartate(D-aspartate) O-methyltransferase